MSGPYTRLLLVFKQGKCATFDVAKEHNSECVGWIRTRDIVKAIEAIGGTVRLPEGMK